MSTYEIIMMVLAILFGGISLIIAANNKVTKTVVGFIDDAESEYKDSTKAGGKKFEWVVDKIYSIIPTILKPFISRELVETLIQKTFDLMESYAKKQINKVIDKAIPDIAVPVIVSPVVVSEPVSVPTTTDIAVIPEVVETPVVATDDMAKTV